MHGCFNRYRIATGIFDLFKFPVERVDFFPVKRVNSPSNLVIGVGTLIGTMPIHGKYQLMNAITLKAL